VNDLFVILSREETSGRVSVIEAEYQIGLAKDCGGMKGCEIGVFHR